MSILERLFKIFKMENSELNDQNEIYENCSELLMNILKNYLGILDGSKYIDYFMEKEIISLIFEEKKVSMQLLNFHFVLF